MILSDRTKKILQIIVFVLAVVALGYLLYVVFFRPTQPPAPAANTNAGNQGFPDVNAANQNTNGVDGAANTNMVPAGIPAVSKVANGGLTQATSLTPEVNTQFPSPDKQGLLRYYNPTDGKFYRVNQTGAITQLGEGQFKSVSKVTWAPTTNDAILEFPDGANIYYNLDTGRQVTLPKEYEEFDFSPTSDRIAFKYMHIDKERRVLAVADADGANARTVEPMGIYDYRVQVNWSPTGRVVATWGEYMDMNRQELGFIGLNNENFKGTVVEGRGIRSTYSPDGQQLLYSVYSENTNYNPNLWIVYADGDSIGKSRRDLNIPTFADKCAFASDSKYAYCGIPLNPRDGFAVAEDFLDGVPDEIYRIDVASGVKSKVAVPADAEGNAKYAVENMTVSTDGRYLYFRDKNSGQLIKIDLK